jgi:hypothetical protein
MTADQALEVAYNRLMDQADAHSNEEKASVLRYAAQVVLFGHSDADRVVGDRIVNKPKI